MTRTTVIFTVLLLMFTIAVVPLSAQTSCSNANWASGGISLSCSFSTSGQSIYGVGNAKADAALSLGTSWNVSGSGGSIWSPTLFGASLGDYGAIVSGSTSGNIALNLDAHASGGSVNATINSGVTISLPSALSTGQVHPGDPFTISSSYTHGAGSTFSTTAPSVAVGASLDFGVAASVSAKICVVYCTGFENVGFNTGQIHQSIFSYNENPSNVPGLNNPIDNSGLSLFGVSLNNLANGANQLSGGLVSFDTTTGKFSADIGPPEPPSAKGIFKINGDLGPSNLLGLAATSTAGAGGVLNASGMTNNDLVSQSLDLTKLLAALAGPEIPPPSGKLGDLLPPGSPIKGLADQVSYNLATISLSNGIKFSQQYSLDPNAPTITLKVTQSGTQGGNPDPYLVSFKAGDNLTLLMPNFNADGTAPSLSITPQMSIAPRFTTNSGVLLDPTLEFSALGLSVGPVSVGPLIDQKFSFNTPQLTIASTSFQLGGIDSGAFGPSSSNFAVNLNQSKVVTFDPLSANGSGIINTKLPGLHFQILNIDSGQTLNIGTNIAAGTHLNATVGGPVTSSLPATTVQYNSASHFYVLQGSTLQGSCGASTSPCANVFLQRDLNAPPVSGRAGDPPPLTYFFLTNNSSLKGVTVYNAGKDFIFFNPNDNTSNNGAQVLTDVASVTNSVIQNNGFLNIANTQVTLTNSAINFDHNNKFADAETYVGGILILDHSQVDQMFLGIGGATRVQNSNIDTDASILGHMISFANDPAHGGMPAELYLQNGSSANIFQLSANGAINLSGNSTLSTVVVKNENAFLTINLDNTSTMSAGNIFSGFGTNVQNVVINNSGGTVNLATVQGATLNGTAGLVNFTASGEVNSFNMTGTSTVNVLRGVTVSLTGRDSLQASNFVNHGTILGSDTSATTTLTGFVDNFGTLHTAPSGPTLTTLNIVGTLSNEVGGLVQVDANSRLKVSSVKQIGGSTVVNGTLTATNGVALQGGTLSGTGLVAGTVNNISGIVAPGNSPGTLMISGDYIQQVGGTLQIQIADLTHFDRLIIGGKAHLDGTLDVLLANTFSLNVGDSFTFLSAAGNIDLTDNMFSSFDFTYADGSTLPLGFTWDVIYGINSVSLLWSRVDDPTALAVALMNGGTLPTDLPKLPFGVLSTDIADAYNAYCAANPTVCSGGVTAGQQLDGDYRASGTGLPPTAPVPEPTSILLLGSGAVAALKLRRRK